MYIDVLHGQEILKATINNQECLQHELNIIYDRYREGDVTSTDLAQARSRLAGAGAQVIQSRGNLKSIKAELERLINSFQLGISKIQPCNTPKRSSFYPKNS